ncbi:MAG: hypothetical protein LBK22_04060 [Tannerella sp.]|jgi:hypothetical protein|nr:hypothetical protein [Tannerella sp.]
MWKRMYYRLIRYADWIWKGNSGLTDCLVPAVADECAASPVDGACCAAKPDRRKVEPLRDIPAETNDAPSAPEEAPRPAIKNVPEHYTALWGAFPSSEEFQASISEPEGKPDATPKEEE